MVPWEFIDSAPVPGNGETLRLYRRGKEYSMRVDGCELMNSRIHGSEDALAELACAKVADRPGARVLIGGLGMGYTTAAALHRLGGEGQVVVAELVPAVVAWNRGVLAHLAGCPLQDGRVTVREIDVARILQEEPGGYDAIMLDVDNGPAECGLCGVKAGRCPGDMVGGSPSGLCPTSSQGGLQGGRGPGPGARPSGGRPAHDMGCRTWLLIHR
jgi:hypothetical protein